MVANPALAGDETGGLRPPAPLPARRAYRPEGRAYASERNMGQGGTRNQSHIPKGCVSETLHLKLRAPQLYPDPYFHEAIFDDI